MGGVSEGLGASLAGNEEWCEVSVGKEVVWEGVEGVSGWGSGESAGVVEVGVGGVEVGAGVGGDDAGVSGGSGSSEAICCCTWSSSAGNDVEGSWSSGKEPSKSLLLVEPVVPWPFRPAPGDLTNRSTSEGLAFSLGRRPSMLKRAAGQTILINLVCAFVLVTLFCKVFVVCVERLDLRICSTG